MAVLKRVFSDRVLWIYFNIYLHQSTTDDGHQLEDTCITTIYDDYNPNL